MVNLVAAVLIFDYLVWIRKHRRHFPILFTLINPDVDLRNLKHSPFSVRSCLLPHTVCKAMSADMFLISIAVWSTLNLGWMVVAMIYYVVETWKFLRRKFINFADAIVVPRAW